MNYAIGASSLTICLVGLGIILSSAYLEQRTRRYFIAFFSILTIYVLFNLLGQIANVHSGHSWAPIARSALFWESLLPSVLTVMITSLLLYQSGEKAWFRNGIFLAAFSMWAFYLALLIYTQFTGVFYFIDDDNVYSRGPYYPQLLVPLVAVMVLNLVALWQKRRKLSSRQELSFMIYAAAPMTAMLLQILLQKYYLILLGTTIGAIAMLYYIIRDQTELYYAQQMENTQLKIDIMLSQIQPHFLYNSLGAIHYLCDHDPKAAGELTDKFARYLRGNMSALRDDGEVPFPQELEHTEIYLEIEKARYEDALQIEYDVACTDFRLPTLTLQPIVENAVRHGARGKRGVGTVCIATREYPDRYEITVTDDGPGFDPDAPALPDDGRAHIGIQNVRERLDRVSGGTLRIESEKGKGTVAAIIIPKKEGIPC